MLLGQQDCTLL